MGQPAAAALPKPRRPVPLPVPREQMSPAVRKWWDTYQITPGAPLYRAEFGYQCMDEWKKQGLPEKPDLAALFHFDAGGAHGIGELGWCEAAFEPPFETKVLEDRGAHELVQDHAGRKLLCFKGRRSGFMPEYLDHPVKDWETWERDVKWRLDPATPQRWAKLDERMAKARAAAAEGRMISQRVIGAYMYLRSLIGPEQVLYFFHDRPDLLHDCMKAWARLADVVIARHQEHVTIDEFFLGEDICYNHGPLISPAMIKEFIFPYYRKVLAPLKAQQRDKRRHLFVHVDTDGFAEPVIPLYQEAIGLDVMSPFEVAAGCDVVRVGRNHPELVIKGGIDKRVLAQGRQAIDRHLEHILPAMRARGGYVPTCDHGVPAEVPLKDYFYYRERCLALGG